MDENNQHTPGAGHEETDINVWAVGKFAVALMLVAVAALFLLFGLFRYLLSREGGPPAGRSQVAASEPAKAFPQPQLQETRGAGFESHSRGGRPGSEQLRLDGSGKGRGADSHRSRHGSAGRARSACGRRRGRRNRRTRNEGLLWLLRSSLGSAAFAQPGQPAPVQPSLSMQDSNLKPALPGELLGVGIDQKLDQQVPLDADFPRRSGPRGPALELLPNREARAAGAGLLPLSHAVHADPERRRQQPESRLAQPRAGFRSPRRQLRSERYLGIWRRRRSRRTCGATAGRIPPTGGTSSPATQPISRL